jgi:uncharacterized protein YqjF (DUF2071 family)
MNEFSDILNTTAHRTYPLPDKPWKQYQQWHGNLLMHWKVPLSALVGQVPNGLTIDTFDGNAWVSIIAFSVKKLRPKFLPSWPPASDFHEVNFRTYVIRDGIPGIYFLSIEAGKLLPVLLARIFIGIPYIKSDISRSAGIYCAKNRKRNLELKATYFAGDPLESSSALDYWLTERHALFQENGNKLHRLDIHHKPWPLHKMDIGASVTGYLQASNALAAAPDLVHYAERLDVLVWGRIMV